MALTPVSINTRFYGGTLVSFEATDCELLADGLADPHELPKPKPGCKVREINNDNFVCSYRMKDGRVRLTMLAELARMREVSHAQTAMLMASLVSTRGRAQ